MLTVLAEKAQRGERVWRGYARRIMTPRSLDMLAKIHAEITPKIEALRALDLVGEEREETEIIAPSVRKGWTWGKVGKTARKGYVLNVHNVGTMENDLASENSISYRLTTSNA